MIEEKQDINAWTEYMMVDTEVMFTQMSAKVDIIYGGGNRPL